MPLLNGELFVRQRLETGLEPNSEIYFCESTAEAFASYDEYFEKAVLCSSMAWSCALTGKTELTFQEAVESEATALSSLGSVSLGLQKAMLFLTQTIETGKFNDICHFLWSYTSCRFFAGEEVEVMHHNEKKPAKIVKVVPPNRATWESLPDLCFGADPSTFKYDVMSTSESMKPFRMVCSVERISRPKGNLTKDKVKLFMKQHVNTYKRQTVTELKESSIKSLKLENLSWEHVFGGPLPNLDPQDESLPTRIRQKHRGSSSASVPQSSEKSDRRKQSFGSEKKPKPGPKPQTPEEKKRKLEEQRKRQAEKKKTAREKAREEKLKSAKLHAEWSRKRDDLECDDLKPLPSGIPIQCAVPNALFGDALLIMEFYNNFDEFFDLKEIFPHGFTFDLLQRILCEKSIKSPISDLIRITLATIFCLQEEEEAEDKRDEKKENETVIEEAAVDDDDFAGDDLRVAMNQALKVQNTLKRVHGPKMSNIELTPLTVSEVLRLHLLTSGAPRTRSIYRGWFCQREDPGLLFRIERPDVIEKLSTLSVYELEVAEKISIFDALIHQVLSFPAFREILEVTIDRIVEVRKEMRSAQADFSRWERENAVKKPPAQRKEGEAEGAAAPQEFTPEEAEEAIAVFSADREKRLAILDKEQAERRQKIRKYEAQYGLKPIGRDRAYRRYWLFNSIPGLFIEQDDPFTGPCVRQPEHDDLKSSSCSPTNNKENEFGEKSKRSSTGSMTANRSSLMHLCTGSASCAIHACNATVKYKWRFSASPDDVQEFVDALNPRGFRESELLQALKTDLQFYEKSIAESPVSKLNNDIPAESKRENSRLVYYKASTTGMSHIDKDPGTALKMMFLDHLSNFEEQLHLAGLSFRANSPMTREEWKSFLQKIEASEADTVDQLAKALRKLGQTVPGNQLRSELQIPKWIECLEDTSSVSRLFFLLSVLESKIEFPQNVSGFCRLCRRKKDPECMLLCDSCNRGHHTYCLKPPLDEVPKGEWFCPKCKQVPKVLKSPRKPVKLVEEEDVDEIYTIDSSRASSSRQTSDNDDDTGSDTTGDPDVDVDLCAVCASTDDDPEAECSQCSRKFHISCHVPKIPNNTEDWVCSLCVPAKSSHNKRKEPAGTSDTVTRVKRTRIALNNASSDQTQTAGKKVRTSARSTRHSDDDGYNYVLCHKMLDKLKRHNCSWPFLKRPIGKDAPNYNDRVKNHIDLGILTQNLNTGVFTSNEDFVRETCLMFGNCKSYWDRGTDQHEAGIELYEFFRALVKENMPQETPFLKHR